MQVEIKSVHSGRVYCFTHIQTLTPTCMPHSPAVQVKTLHCTPRTTCMLLCKLSHRYTVACMLHSPPPLTNTNTHKTFTHTRIRTCAHTHTHTCQQELVERGIQLLLPKHHPRAQQERKQQLVLLKQGPVCTCTCVSVCICVCVCVYSTAKCCTAIAPFLSRAVLPKLVLPMGRKAGVSWIRTNSILIRIKGTPNITPTCRC